MKDSIHGSFSNKKLLILVLVFIALSAYNVMNIEKQHPGDPYIIKNADDFEGKQVFLRATVVDISNTGGEYVIQGKTAGKIYRIFIKDDLLDRIPSGGDLIDFKAISHLNQGYVTAIEAHTRTGLEHKLLFARSLVAVPIVLLLLWRERHQIIGGTECRTG